MSVRDWIIVARLKDSNNEMKRRKEKSENLLEKTDRVFRDRVRERGGEGEGERESTVGYQIEFL